MPVGKYAQLYYANPKTPVQNTFQKVRLNHYWYILTVSRKGGLYQNKKERIQGNGTIQNQYLTKS
jgi:hypothetical protein